MLQELGAAQGMDVSIVSLVSDGSTESPETVRTNPLHGLRKMHCAVTVKCFRESGLLITVSSQHNAQKPVSHLKSCVSCMAYCTASLYSCPNDLQICRCLPLLCGRLWQKGEWRT